MPKAANAHLHCNDNNIDSCFIPFLLFCKYDQTSAMLGMCLGPILSFISAWDYFQNEILIVKIFLCIFSLIPGMFGGAFVGMFLHVFLFDFSQESLDIEEAKCQKQSQQSYTITKRKYNLEMPRQNVHVTISPNPFQKQHSFKQPCFEKAE